VASHRLPAVPNTLSSPDGTGMPSPKCEEVLTNFWDYVDGSCAPDIAGRIEAHVSTCVPCLRFRQSQQLFFNALAALRQRSPAPARLHDRVRKALAAERWESRPH
jgi:hypothetical protein